MLIFWKQKLAFLAIPKTGTSAYAQALAPVASLSLQDPPELKHAPLIRYNRFIRPMYEIVCNTQLDTMAVIREPISWMGSWYRYRQRPFLKGKPTSTQDITFDTFARGYLQTTPPPMRIKAVRHALSRQGLAHRPSHIFSGMRTNRACVNFWNTALKLKY